MLQRLMFVSDQSDTCYMAAHLLTDSSNGFALENMVKNQIDGKIKEKKKKEEKRRRMDLPRKNIHFSWAVMMMIWSPIGFMTRCVLLAIN